MVLITRMHKIIAQKKVGILIRTRISSIELHCDIVSKLNVNIEQKMSEIVEMCFDWLKCKRSDDNDRFNLFLFIANEHSALWFLSVAVTCSVRYDILYFLSLCCFSLILLVVVAAKLFCQLMNNHRTEIISRNERISKSRA